MTTREAARLRKQRQRARQREAARLAALDAAARAEAVAEELAPAVMRNPVMLPDGRTLIGSRVQIVNGRAVRAVALCCPIATSRSSQITKAHKDAARSLQLDWNDVGAGLGVGAVDWLRSGGGGSGDGGHDAMMHQVRARARMEGAMAHLGALAPSIARVVLDGLPIAEFAAETGRTDADAVAWIVIGLDRLAAFYKPATGRPSRIRVIAPGRSEYDMEAA